MYSIDNLCMNHVMYADDNCLMVPSPAALQELINICFDFSVRNDLSFNSYVKSRKKTGIIVKFDS